MKSTRAKLLFILFIFVFLVVSAGLISCDKVYDIESVELTSTPSFVTEGLELGDSLDFTGVGLKVAYANGVIEYVDLTEAATVSGFNKDIPGDQVITVTYTNGTVEKEVSLTVNVRRPAVKTIVLQSASKNTTYLKGEALNLTDLSAVVTYDKIKTGSEYYTETFTLSLDNLKNQKDREYTYNPELVGEQTLRFLLYSDVYAELKIKVSDHLVKSIARHKDPIKIAYAEDAPLDLTGAQLMLYMNDSATSQVYTVISDGNGGWTLQDFHGSVTVKDLSGNPFDSSTIGVSYLYLYYTEGGTDSPVLRTGTYMALNIVDKDLSSSNSVTFSSELPRQIQNSPSGLLLNGVTMTVNFNDQTSATYPMDVTYDATLDIYKGQGFYIRGYDISSAVAQEVSIHFYKFNTLADGSIEYISDEYATHFKATIITIEEAVSSITITDNSTKGEKYTRYIDLSNPSAYSFSGYVDDIIPVSQYIFTFMYNSGKEEDFTFSELSSLSQQNSAYFSVDAPTTYFDKVGDDFRLKQEGSTTLTFGYNNNVITRVVDVTVKTPSFDNTNAARLIFTPPSKLEYDQASPEALDLTGAKAEIYLEDPDTKAVVNKIELVGEALRPYVTTTIDFTKAGNPQIISMDYLGAIRTFDIVVMSEVERITLSVDDRIKTDFVKGTAFNRAEDFRGLAIAVEYKDEAVDDEIIEDFTDSSWAFRIDGVDLAIYPLEAGYVHSYNVTVSYMGVEMDTTIEITVHNYIESIAMAADNPPYNVIQGVEISAADYDIVATYEDGSNVTLPMSDSIFSFDYEYNDLTTGERTVTVSVASSATGGKTVECEHMWLVEEKTSAGYILSVKAGVSLETITIASAIDEEDFVLRRYFNNGTSDTTSFVFSTYDASTVPVGGSQIFDVNILVGDEPVEFSFTSPDEDIIQSVQNGTSIQVKVTYDVVISVEFAVGGTMLEVKEGYDFSDLSLLSGWALNVTYKNDPAVKTLDVVDGEFGIEDYDKNIVGVQTVTLVANSDKNIKIQFNVKVIEKILTSLSLPENYTKPVITEGKALTNDIFTNVYLIATYDNGTTENISIFVNSSKMQVLESDGDAYDTTYRITSEAESEDKDLKIVYNGFSQVITLTLLKRQLVGIKLDSANMPKDEYRELEAFLVDAAGYLLTADNTDTRAQFFLSYNNDDLSAPIEISLDMLVDFSKDLFNRTDLTADTVVPVKIEYMGYNATFNIWLRDRLSVKIDKGQFDSNRFSYYYGETPVIDYTLRYFTSATDTEGTVVNSATISFISQSNVVYIPRFVGGVIDDYVIEGTAAIVDYLPIGTYTVDIKLAAIEHSSTVVGLNAYENTDKVLTIVATPLKTGFDTTNANLTLDDGQYFFRDVYGNATYPKAYFEALVTYSHSLDSGESYISDFVEGAIRDRINTNLTIRNSQGNIVDSVKSADRYIISVELTDKELSSILTNYQITTYELVVEIAKKRVEVQFYNSTDIENSNRINVVYGSSQKEIDSDYYIVDGLVEGDILNGALGKNYNGFNEINGNIERFGNDVGYYRIQLGTLSNPNYDLFINSQDGYFEDVYYVVNEAPIDITIDNKSSVYGGDGEVKQGEQTVGTISLYSQLFSINGIVYNFIDSTIYVNVPVGQINLTEHSFTVGGVAYTYVGSNILKNGFPQSVSNISTSARTITLGAKEYFYIESDSGNNIFEKLGMISTTMQTITISQTNTSYRYTEKADVNWSITLSSSDNKYTQSYDVELIDGRFVDNSTGLDIAFDVLFAGGARPQDVGDYGVSGILDTSTISSYNYKINTITSGSYSITPKAITIIPVEETKIYDGIVDTAKQYGYQLEFAEVSDLNDKIFDGYNIGRVAGESVGKYLFTSGDLTNQNFANYTFTVAEGYYTIVERAIFMEFAAEAITKEYDGDVPGIDFKEYDFTLYYLDDSGNKVLWDTAHTLVDIDSLSMSFALSDPGCGNYAMTLTEEDFNHNIVLDKQYSYSITEKLIDVSFVTRLNNQDDIDSNWVSIVDGDSLVYNYNNPRLVKAIPIGIVAGEAVTVGVDFIDASNVGSYKVTAITIDGSNNYKFREQNPSLTFNIVRKNIYVFVSSDNLTQDYYGSSMIRINDFELYSKFESISSTVALDAVENAALENELTFVIGDGNSSSWTQNGYSVRVNLSSKFNQNYTINTVSDKQYKPTSYDSLGQYVDGYGGSLGNNLIYIINKLRVDVEIIDTNLSKYFDDAAPYIRSLSVEPQSILEQVQGALVFTRLTTPYEEAVADDTPSYEQKDIGTFSVTIDNARLMGDAANYYCTLKSDYVYEIKPRTVTITMSQGSAQHIYRRYDGRHLTHADIVEQGDIDGVTRTISFADYRPLTITSSQQIIERAGIKFVFTNLKATEVGYYDFYVVADDYNHNFVIAGQDDDGLSTFEIRRKTLDINISNTIYRYYQGSDNQNDAHIDRNYYDSEVEGAINLADHYEIQSQIYEEVPEQKSVTSTVVDGKITIDGISYLVVDNKLYKAEPILGVYAKVANTEVIIGKSSYTFDEYDQMSDLLYVYNNDNTAHEYAGTLDSASQATIYTYKVRDLTKTDFTTAGTQLGLETDLSYKDIARVYTGRLQFNIASTFEELYPNYALPGLTSKIIEIKPNEIEVTINTSYDIDKQYGNSIRDIEKQLLVNGDISYVTPDGVIYSGSIDSSLNLIEVYSTKYYYMDSEIFLILGDITINQGAGNLLIGDKGYIIDAGSLYRIYGSFAIDTFTVDKAVYYIKDNTSIYLTRVGNGTTIPYEYAGLVGTIDGTIITINNSGTYQVRGSDIISADKVGDVIEDLNSINIDGTRYSYANGYVYMTAGTIDVDTHIITIGNYEYIYVDTKVFAVVGHYDDNLLTIERQTYAQENNNLYINNQARDGNYDAANKYFEVGSLRYVYDVDGNIYEVVGALVADGNNNAFDLRSTNARYYYNNGQLYQSYNGVTYSSPYSDTTKYNINTTNKTITVDGSKYTYLDNGYIRAVNGQKTDSAMTIAGVSYVIDGQNAVWTADNIKAGEYNTTTNIVTASDKSYFVDGSNLYEIIGNCELQNNSVLTVTVPIGKYVVVGEGLYSYKGYFDSQNNKITIGDTDYILSGRYIFYDTQKSVGTYENNVFTLGDDIYYIIDKVVYTKSNTIGTIELAQNEFTISNTQYIFATSDQKVIAYNTEQVTFTYYTKNEAGEYVKIAMSNTQDVGEYWFTVNFGGDVINVVDGVSYYGNYIFKSEEKPITVSKAVIKVTLDGELSWTYRQPYLETEDGDFTRANLSSLMTFSCNMDEPFDQATIKYPVLKAAEREYFDYLVNSAMVGEPIHTINSDSFTDLDSTNGNYIFEITGEATIRVIPRKLSTSVVKIDGNTIIRTITADYGTMPDDMDQLAVLYSGLSASEFAGRDIPVFDTVVYHPATQKWYIVYNYSTTADSNEIEDVAADSEQFAMLQAIIRTNVELPNLYKGEPFIKDGKQWIDLYDAGVTNRLSVPENNSFESQNYEIDAVDNFIFIVNPVELTLTLEPVNNVTNITKIYGTTVIMGEEYSIAFTDADGNRIDPDQDGNIILMTITIGGVTYIVDTADSVFFDYYRQQQEGEEEYNWLVYDNRVNMTNAGAPIGARVYLSLGKAEDPTTGTPATSKFEGLTTNYTLSYQGDNIIEIQIYNKIASIAVGEGALYSAVVGDDPYIPLTVTYVNGTKNDTLRYNLNTGDADGLTLGDADGSFGYITNHQSGLGNQIVKLTYTETNNGIDGGYDIAYVYITLRSYATTDTTSSPSSTNDQYREFSYVTYMPEDLPTVDNIDLKSILGAISLDTDGDGDKDIYFLMVAVAEDGIFIINNVEYNYSGTLITRVDNGNTVGTIDLQEKSMIIDGTTYYYATETNIIGIYQTKVDTVLMTPVGEFSMTRYVYARNYNLAGSTTVRYAVPDGTTSTDQFVLDGTLLGFEDMIFEPSATNNVEIILEKSYGDNTINYVDIKEIDENLDTLAEFDITNTLVDNNAIKLDINNDGVADYYLLFVLTGKVNIKTRLLYIYRNGDDADKFVTLAMPDEDATNWSLGSVGTLSDVEFSFTGSDFDLLVTLKAIDKGYTTVNSVDRTYSFGDLHTVDDGLTHEYKTTTIQGEYDKLQMEFSLKPLYNKDGEFNFVVFSYKDAQNTVYELSLRLLTGAANKGKLYVVESVDGRETITSYYTYREVVSGTTGTYFDMLDGKNHHIDVYLNRLSCALTVVIDDAIKLSHSLFSETGIQLDANTTLPDVRFPLEDYSSYYDNDKIYITNTVVSTAYFTVRNLTFNVSSIDYTKMGYSNAMAIILTPSESAETVVYVDETDPLKAITISDYFEIFGNYYEDTVIKYYLNGLEIKHPARRIWLEEGVYCLTAQIFYGDTMLSEADFYLSVAISKGVETDDEDDSTVIEEDDVSYTSPLVLEASDTQHFGGSTQQHYNYYRAEFMLNKPNGDVVYDGSVYNIVLNLKSNDKTTSAFSATSNEYIGLSLGIMLGDTIKTDLMLRVKGMTVSASTEAINWLATVDGNYVVEAYMDDYNKVIVVTIYRDKTKLHTFVMKKDSIFYSTTNINIETEKNSSHIIDFVDSVGSQSIILTNIQLVLFDINLESECDIRQSLYMFEAGGVASAKFNSSGNPVNAEVSSGQYVAIMLGNGDNLPYAMDYNSYSAEFSIRRSATAGGAAQVRFIIAENKRSIVAANQETDDLRAMHEAYSQQDNFTATRSIAVVYVDDGTTASMYFTFMVNGLTNVYRQEIYTDIADRNDWRVLSDEERHSISVNIFKAPESVSIDELFTTSDVFVMFVQVVIDGHILTDASGKPKNYYFPYFNSVAFWEDIDGDATSDPSVDISDKYFLDQYTMAGVVIENCIFNLYNLQVAKGDSLTVDDQYILDVVKSGDESNNNFYYYDYFSELYGLGGAYLKRTEQE